METVIVLCLLIIIVLLVQDKIVIRKRSEQRTKQGKVNPHLPDIMGQPKPVQRHVMPNTDGESPIAEPEVDPANLDIEYDENEIVGVQIPQEELDEVFDTAAMINAEEEEEQWRQDVLYDSEAGLATGVTYEELTTAGQLLQHEVLAPDQEQTVVDIVQRTQGTELFALLNSAVEGASEKIASMLDKSLSTPTASGSSTLRKNDLDDFDIGEFI